MRRTGFVATGAASTIGAATLVLATLVGLIGSAQAAPSTKFYDASVQLTNGATDDNTFTLTLANPTKSKQSIGSANFTAPPNFIVPAASQQVTTEDGHDWTVTSDGSRLVKFRADSSADALAPNQFVSASVDVVLPAADDCDSAVWTTEAKQSNDFSGQPGNETKPNVVDLTPLGSFAIDPIVTVEDGQTIPAILTDEPHTSKTEARDTCGIVKTDYAGAATLTRVLLTEATFVPDSGLKWTSGVGEVALTPKLTETDNRLIVTDPETGVFAGSNFFDTTDTLCTPADTEPCHWQDKEHNPGVLADAAPPPPGANLGIGFNPKLPFSCDGVTSPVGSTVVNINPRGAYTGPFTVSLTYKKSVSGSRAPSSFVVCLSDDNGATWTKSQDGGPLSACASSPPVASEAPCIQTLKRTSGGDLLVELYLDPSDPWTGLG